MTHRTLVFVMVGLLTPLPAAAQQVVTPIAPRPEAERPEYQVIPLDIHVVISRVQDTKKISSVPYSLAVNASLDRPPSQLRMGASIPVSSNPPAGSAGAAVAPTTTIRYNDIGTNLDCQAQPLEDGRFDVRLTVEDTSVYSNTQDRSLPTVGDMPVFRTFRVSNTLVLRDGQTRQFTAATDRVSGEIVRIDVTLRVVK